VAAVRRAAIARGKAPSMVTAGFAVALLVTVSMQWMVFFRADLLMIDRLLYGTDPFPEAIEVAKYLEAHTSPDERVAVIGSEPEIYFYARRKSATGYIYTYALMEIQKFADRMQKEMMDEVDRANPRYVVMVSSKGSWIRREGSELAIFRWLEAKVRNGYVTEGIVEVQPDGTTNAVWGAEAAAYKPRSREIITIYRRM
jgi:hypothetical protein